MEQSLEKLEERVNNIQHKDLKGFGERLNSVEKKLERNDLLTEMIAKSNEKIADAVSDFKVTANEFSNEIKRSNDAQKEIVGVIEGLKQNISSLDGKIDIKVNNLEKDYNNKINEIKVDHLKEKEKNLIDIRDVFKKNWFKIVSSVAVGGYILSQLAESLPK